MPNNISKKPITISDEFLNDLNKLIEFLKYQISEVKDFYKKATAAEISIYKGANENNIRDTIKYLNHYLDYDLDSRSMNISQKQKLMKLKLINRYNDLFKNVNTYLEVTKEYDVLEVSLLLDLKNALTLYDQTVKNQAIIASENTSITTTSSAQSNIDENSLDGLMDFIEGNNKTSAASSFKKKPKKKTNNKDKNKATTIQQNAPSEKSDDEEEVSSKPISQVEQINMAPSVLINSGNNESSKNNTSSTISKTTTITQPSYDFDDNENDWYEVIRGKQGIKSKTLVNSSQENQIYNNTSVINSHRYVSQKEGWSKAREQNHPIYVNAGKEKVDITLLTESQYDVRALSYEINKKQTSVNDKVKCSTPILPFQNAQHLEDGSVGLAGLLTYDLEKQGCTALTIVMSYTKNPMLLIANSAVNNSNGVIGCLQAVQQYLNDSSFLGYKKFIEWSKDLISYKLQHDKKILKILEDLFHGHPTFKTDTCEDWIEFVNSSSQYKKESWAKDLADYILRPITDCMRIADAYTKDKMDKRLIEVIKNFNGELDNSPFVMYLADYIPSMHPDMKILDTLIKGLQDKIITAERKIKIITSKDPCGPCSEAFKVTEKYSEQICKIKELEIDTSGTSGVPTRGFIAPEAVAPYLVEVLKTLADDKNSTRYPINTSTDNDCKTDLYMPFNVEEYKDSLSIMGNPDLAEHN